MASVIVLQSLHGLSDAETVDAVTFDLRWKAACGLPVTAAAFHPTTLTYWRRRLAASEQPNRIFDAVRAVVAETGALKGKTRRALDSTILDDAVATQDTVTQLIAAIRRVRRDVPGAAEVIAAHCTAHDYDDPGKPAIAWNDQAARGQLIDALVGDAHRVLGHLPDQELGPKAAEATALLALIAGQDVEPVDGSDGTDGRWQIAQRVAPDRVISVVDQDARHAHKTVHRRQDGFKAHVAIEPDTGIVTDCELTKASGPRSGDAVIKPIPLRSAVPGGFTLDDFTIDTDAGTVTCPNGLTRAITTSRSVTFGAACRGCPFLAQCTTSKKGRVLSVHEHEALLRAARRQAETEEFQRVYRQHRPMVERTIAWLTRRNRRVRYRGVTKNDHWLHHRAAAINLRRLVTMGLTRTGRNWAITSA
jgi:IS5 family transposase